MFNKKKYRFELIQVQNVRTDNIRNAADLVNFIIGENQGLLEHEENGSLVVSKIELSKKGEQILFAQHLELPMSSKTNFDSLLEPFYTKKPLEFDESILDNPDEKKISIENAERERSEVIKDTVSAMRENGISYDFTPQTSIQREENDADYAPAPQLDLSEDDEESELDFETNQQNTNEEQSEPSKDMMPTETKVPSSTMLTEAAIKEIVANEMRGKDEEIERLSKALKAQGQEDIVEEEHLSVKEESISDAILPTPTINSVTSEDANVLDMINMVKVEASKRLNEFLAQEKAKITADIEALDTRNEIEPILTKRLGDEKEIQAHKLNRKVDLEKAEAVLSENTRHENALKSIEMEHEASRAAQLAKLKDEFNHKLSSAIKEEYVRQTEQLNLILQGKTEELQLRQKAVNEGMKNTVIEVLEGFNTNHGEVIQTVERRKNSSSVISLHQRVG